MRLQIFGNDQLRDVRHLQLNSAVFAFSPKKNRSFINFAHTFWSHVREAAISDKESSPKS
jgi:hypothetical protein